MRVYLVRHGETDWNIERRCQGFSDIPLNETGRRQAKAIAQYLSAAPIEAVYSSTLGRAYETASAVARHHSLEVRTSDAFRELNQGEFEGLRLGEMTQRYGDFLKRWLEDPADLKLPGGESLREVQDRAWAALEGVVETHPKGTVAIVGHNLCNAAVLCRVLNLHLSDFRRIHQDVAGINLLEFGGRWPHPVVLRLNDTCHL
jgi:broad specificity phosphatase PhoE